MRPNHVPRQRHNSNDGYEIDDGMQQNDRIFKDIPGSEFHKQFTLEDSVMQGFSRKKMKNSKTKSQYKKLVQSQNPNPKDSSSLFGMKNHIANGKASMLDQRQMHQLFFDYD
jgi:hypothetical protein